ncbi:MAG: TrbI/VirB10 family protein [Alphaproteobacteria bacterium]|nr:TrbI/VirB10 family protein [Alphaproteobacteria bacterium]
MAESRESLSEQSKRRTTWILSVLGLIVFILFLLVLCSVRQKKNNNQQIRPVDDFSLASTVDDGSGKDSRLPSFGVGGAELLVTPSEVSMDQVVLGGLGEAVLVLRAKNAPIVFLQKYLAENPENGFMLGGPCMEKTQLNENDECLLKVTWKPITVGTIQNTLTIVWREDNPRVLRDERTQIQLKGSSTDSKECVCCEVEKEKGTKHRRQVMLANGETRDLKDGETVDGELLRDEKGNIVPGVVVEPKRIALSLKNEYLGEVTEYRTVEKDGVTLGRLLGDDTLVDTELNVLGAALPVTSVINAQGTVIGKFLIENNSIKVIDNHGDTIGYPRVDGSVVDSTGSEIGTVRDWGYTLDLSGNLLGAILPTGDIINGDNKVVGHLQQNGFVTDSNGTLLGRIVPQGVAVGTNGTSYGVVALNGQVKDNYGQIVGRVMPDGTVVDGKLNELGAVVRQGLIADVKGVIVGFINSEGKGVSNKETMIGFAGPDGMVTTGKKTIGGVLQKGKVVGNACNVLGSVYPDGQVMSQDVQPTGVVRADGYVLNNKNKVIGVVVPRGTVMAEGCRLMGLISLTGQVVNKEGMSVGCVNMQKRAVKANGVEIGAITPVGVAISPDGSVKGYIRYDGRVIDREGKVIDCVDPSGLLQDAMNLEKGVVLGDNGLPSGLMAMSGKCFNERNEEVGSVAFNGWASDKQGHMIGFMPPNGVIVSVTGAVLGTYNRLLGEALNANGDELGRVMPDLTVLNMAGNQVLGSLIPQNTTFVGLNGEFVGMLSLDGQVVDETGQVVGKVMSDGALYSTNNVLIGAAVPTGVVLSAMGTQVGWANANGDVMSKGTRIGSVLGNGLVVNPDNRVIGRVWMPMSVVVSGEGMSGTIVPRATSKTDTMSYQLAAYDKAGNYLGVVSPFGTVLTTEGRLGGVAEPIGLVMSTAHELLGWVTFRGEVVDAEGKDIGRLGQNGLVFDADGYVIGSVIHKGTVVDRSGAYIGRVSADGAVYGANGLTDFVVGAEGYVWNNDLSSVGRVLREGIAVGGAGQMLGWTAIDGRIMNSTEVVGRVSLDNRVLGENNAIVGGYVPLGTPSMHEDIRQSGIVTESGAVMAVSGRNLGVALAPDYTMENGALNGRLRTGSLYVRNLRDDGEVGGLNLDGTVYRDNSTKQVGTAMMNDYVMDADKKLTGAVVPMGLMSQINLSQAGTELMTGALWLGGRVQGNVSGMGVLYKNAGVISGSVTPPATIIDRVGAVVGQLDAKGQVVDFAGKVLGVKTPFYSALTPETLWIGGQIKTGAIIDDYARKVGVVAADGTIVGSDRGFKGRVLADGSSVGVDERAVYNTMPYNGHLVAQGLPIGYGRNVLGRTTVHGDIIDSSDKIIYNLLDDATVLGKERPLEGVVVPFYPAISHDDTIMGTMDGDARMMSSAGEDLGFVDSAGAIFPHEVKSELEETKNIGRVIPDALVTTDSCSIVGQTTYNGEVVNGQGNIVGRIQPTLYATNAQGKVLGHTVVYGPVTSEQFSRTSVFVGRTLPDSTVVDPNGVTIGCGQTDTRVVDPNGNTIGWVRERGPVFGTSKKMEGRVDAMGNVICMDGRKCGVIVGGKTAIWVDENGERKGWMAPKSTSLGFNKDGTLKYAVTAEGWVKDPETGEDLFQWDYKKNEMVLPDGTRIKPDGDNFVILYDMANKPVARLIGCELRKLPGGEKMAALMADGALRDDNNDILLTVTPDGKVYNPDGSQYGQFRGIGLDLRKCGLSSANMIGSGRKIILKGKPFTVENGSLVDSNGNIVGYMGEDGRPFFFESDKIDGPIEVKREPPVMPKPMTITPEQRQIMTELMFNRRKQMREKMSSTPGIIPGPEILAKAKKHQDKDWSSIGAGKSISTWPVDMTHVLLKDKAIPAVLTRAIDSRYADVPVTAVVERHIYAEEGRNILIPAGSHLIGKAESGGDGDSGKAVKLSISWERLIRPDGAAFAIEAVSGDAMGRGGVAAYLDEQMFKKYTAPWLSTAVEIFALEMTSLNEKSGASGNSVGHDVRQMISDRMEEMFNQMIDEAKEVPNIVYVPSGTRITVFAGQDLWLRAVSDDQAKLEAENGKPSTKAGTPPSEYNPMKKREPQEGNEENSSNENKGQPTGGSPNVAGGSSVGTIYPAEEPNIDDRLVQPVSQPPTGSKSYF